jgi:neutral ceramidase
MIGFAGRGSAGGIHDDLTATALVLEGPPAQLADDAPTYAISRLAIIACDLLFLRLEEVRAVREAVGHLTDIRPDQVVIACSHTHYGPLTEPGHDRQAPQVDPYLANLVQLLAGAVAMARAATVPCQLGFGQGEVRIGINPRQRTADGQIILGQNPAGPVDPRLAVLRVDGTDGRPLAAMLNYACHLVSLGSQCTDISSDFPGIARRLVEEQTGATCLFLQGAAGNINPLLMGWDWTHLVRLGLPLGAEAVRVYLSIVPSAESTGGGLSVAHSQLQLSPLLPASIDAGRATIATLEMERERLLAGGDRGALWWTEKRLERAQGFGCPAR